ncbi:unnamed protein product [Brassica oleracea]
MIISLANHGMHWLEDKSHWPSFWLSTAANLSRDSCFGTLLPRTRKLDP